jgi:hypothetical protein
MMLATKKLERGHAYVILAGTKSPPTPMMTGVRFGTINSACNMSIGTRRYVGNEQF